MNRPLLQAPDRRDWFLILIGAFDILLGYAYLNSPVSPAARATLKIALDVMPLWMWGVCWITAGAWSVLAAFTERRVGGFAAAPMMPAFWGSVCGLDWLHGDSPMGWFSLLLFWALAGAVCCVAGLIDPTPIVSGGGEDASAFQ